MKLLTILIFGVLSLFLCFLSAFFTKTEKVKTFIAIKGLANFSYILLALIACNLIFKIQAYTLFIIVGLALFMFSTTIRAIPTRSDMFHTFYTFVEALGFAFMIVSVFFLIELPLYGLASGAGAFLILMIIYLVLRKADQKKDKFANLILQLASLLLLCITLNLVIISFTTQSLVMAIGALFATVYVIIQTFTTFTNKKCGIVKNIFIGLALICLALSIFFI